MNKQKEIKPQSMIIWRDSVAAGDDVFAPHEQKIKIEDDETIETTLEKIVASHYLPSIQGGKATWILVGKIPLAIVAQQWSTPHFLVKSGARTKDLIDLSHEWQVEFRYWGQAEPLEVIANIQQGKQLPDRYGRDKKKQTSLLERLRDYFSS